MLACRPLNSLSGATEEARGAVYTRREVVEALLDSLGYVPSEPLHQRSILEPASGKGDFVFPTLDRLLESFYRHGGTPLLAGRLRDCILAVELSPISHARTKADTREYLTSREIPFGVADQLVESWFLNADFLLADLPPRFDYVVGNPPYIRQESIPGELLAEYRRRFKTLYDRADIYIPFIERSLNLLAPGGLLAFICADRWMKNKYGGPLRNMISAGFQLRYVLNVDQVDAFTSDVIAYPAIFVVENALAYRNTRIGTPPHSLPELRKAVHELIGNRPSDSFRELETVVSGDAPWLVESGRAVRVLRELEQAFPPIEEAGCKVGIGVATGADRVFIAPLEELDIEDSRKLPLVTTKDITSGELRWRGLGVINPFERDGTVALLSKYPRFRAYIEANEELIKKRNVAKRSGDGWYRTIDRIYPELVHAPKLLIPDIKDRANVVFDRGDYYPHHNLYYITSEEWEMRALQAVLLSSVTRLFVASYSTKMRGGFLRYQAQYLRRIRLPKWETVSDRLRQELARAAEAHDLAACNAATLKLYGVTDRDIEI